MDEKLVIRNTLNAAVSNWLNFYHHRISNINVADKNERYSYICRSLASIAENCRECNLAGKNLKRRLKEKPKSKVVK